MSSILQNIETRISAMDEEVLNVESLEYLVCYLGYCVDAHLTDDHIDGFFTDMSFIELPTEIIDRLIRAGYINVLGENPVFRSSAYFYYPGTWGENSSEIYSRQFAYKLTERAKDAFIEFCERPLKERTARIENFLKGIKDYIDKIYYDHLNQLAKCC